MKPDIFDQYIYGYESTKATLRQIADILRNSELYQSKGAVLPHGALLLGIPGTGKSTMCSCLMKASGRKAVVFRKSLEENAFLGELTKAFEDAVSIAPSVIVLEDIHLYGNSIYSSEWAALQSAIDNCKDQDVFVVATANETSYIAPSLLRPGRFDYILNIDPPKVKQLQLSSSTIWKALI